MSGNKLSGNIPSTVDSLDKLMFIDLAKQESSSGGLTGPLPSLANLRSIKRVDFSENALTGSIPPSFLSSVLPGESFGMYTFSFLCQLFSYWRLSHTRISLISVCFLLPFDRLHRYE